MPRPNGFETLAELRAWLARAPQGTAVGAETLAGLLDGLEDAPAPAPPEPSPETPAPTWRERLWTAPAETRIGVRELCEAVGRPKSWIYRRTGPKATDRLPHRKLDGELTFLVGELRHWIREHEDIIEAGPVLHTDGERTLSAA